MTLWPLVFLWTGLASAGEVATSTAHARRAPEPEFPWSINYGIDRRGRRSVGFDYNVRWDPAHLFETTDASRGRRTSPVEDLGDFALDLLGATRLNVYGVRIKPFRARESGPVPVAVAASTGTGQDARVPYYPAPRRRSLVIEPLADLRRNGRREAERFLVREGFDAALPRARGAPYWQKEAVSRGLLDAGRSWSDEPLYSLPEAIR